MTHRNPYGHSPLAPRIHHRGDGPPPAVFGEHPGHDGTITITVAPCQTEGMVLMQGKANYYLHCTRNPRTGGFYQQVYLCPSDMHSIADALKCIPPPDCSACANEHTGRRRGHSRDRTLNGGSENNGVASNVQEDIGATDDSNTGTTQNQAHTAGHSDVVAAGEIHNTATSNVAQSAAHQQRYDKKRFCTRTLDDNDLKLMAFQLS